MIRVAPRTWLIASSLLALAGKASSYAQPTVHWTTRETTPARAVVEVTGLDPGAVARLARHPLTPEQWQWVLAVHAAPAGTKDSQHLPAMLGSYELKDERLTFSPAFPLTPGVEYRAVFRPPSTRSGQAIESVTARFQIAEEPQASATSVQTIYPTSSTIPENLLKFYLQFSAPMSRGGIYQHLHLLEEDGTAVELPFLELDEELWDPTMTRLTLLIDPGRIKRGGQTPRRHRPGADRGESLSSGRRRSLCRCDRTSPRPAR